MIKENQAIDTDFLPDWDNTGCLAERHKVWQKVKQIIKGK